MSTYIRKFRALLKKNETVRGLFLVGIVILAAVAVWGGIRLALNTPYPILVVSSASMCPVNNCVLPVGALVVIHGADPASIGLGQIIVFRNDPNNPDFLVIHRVVGIVAPGSNNYYPGEYGFSTKGDANSGPDCWNPPACAVPGSWVVGVYQYTIPIPYLGSAILAIRDFMYNSQTGQVNPQGILIIVALIIALFAFEVATPGKKDKQAKDPDAQPQPQVDAPTTLDSSSDNSPKG